MTGRGRVVLIAVAALLTCRLAVAAVTVKVAKSKDKTGVVTYVAMDSGKKVYRVNHFQIGVGLGPQGANWYSGPAFLEIGIGKARASKRPTTVNVLQKGPEAGVVEITWQFDEGTAKARFEVRDGDDKVLVTVELPKAETRWVRFRCYPSSFGGGWKQGLELRQRRGITAKLDHKVMDPATKKEKRLSQRLSADEPWVMYMDDHFDVAVAGKKDLGPCGLLYSPEEIAKAVAMVNNYNCDTSLTPKPDATSIRVALWDFTGKTNAEALEIMKAVSVDMLPTKSQ